MMDKPADERIKSKSALPHPGPLDQFGDGLDTSLAVSVSVKCDFINLILFVK